MLCYGQWSRLVMKSLGRSDHMVFSARVTGVGLIWKCLVLVCWSIARSRPTIALSLGRSMVAAFTS